ncbi:MAG: bestrophin family ion channel [Bacteroidota bacterium]
MIKYNPKSWAKLIFVLHKSDTFRILWKEIIYIGVFTLFIAWLKVKYFPNVEALSNLVSLYSIIGFVISLLLVFRTNTAYDRWWEGRRKWGEVVNDSRNLAAKLAVLLDDPKDREFFARMIPNFSLSMKEHLRTGVSLDDLTLIKEEREQLEGIDHVPSKLISMMYERLQHLLKIGTINLSDQILLEKNLNNLLDCIGACERIKSTPIPFSYSLFLKKFIFVYVITLPLAFVNAFGYFSAFIATFVFYVLVSIEVLAEEIEDPFGSDDNDLPTDQITIRIRRVVVQLLGGKQH